MSILHNEFNESQANEQGTSREEQYEETITIEDVT